MDRADSITFLANSVSEYHMLLCCLKVLDSELKAYSGIVKNLGKEADKLKKTDPANAKEIAAEQVYSRYISFVLQLVENALLAEAYHIVLPQSILRLCDVVCFQYSKETHVQSLH